MKNHGRWITAAASGIAMAVLILDTKTALSGAQEGITLCLRTVIPSLFPFILISLLLTGSLMGQHTPMLRPLGKLFRVPEGAESLLVIGFLGGYPVGAQCIAQAYRSGQLSRESAHRMLAYCSNAGPAFLFGMITSLFTSASTVWILWGILILSALLTAWLLPAESAEKVNLSQSSPISPVNALERALRVMAGICGWVVVFRVVIAFCQRWFLWLFPAEYATAMIGFLELTNGCILLRELPQEGLRFVLCSVFLSFGGICVGMQTVSVTADLGTGQYFPGKLMQSGISFLLAAMVQRMLFPDEQLSFSFGVIAVFSAAVVLAVLALKKRKINSSNLVLSGV